MLRQNIEHAQPVFDPAARGDAFAEHDLFALVVRARAECESHVAARAKRPSGEAARDGDHVILRVSAVNAERVQLHQLARVIFVQSWTAGWRQRIAVGVELLRWRRPLHLAHEIVEVKEHRRALRDGCQQFFEIAQRVWADHVAFVRSQQPAVSVFLSEDIEVVEPEINHHFLQLLFTEDGAQQFGLLQFAQRLVLIARRARRLRRRLWLRRLRWHLLHLHLLRLLSRHRFAGPGHHLRLLSFAARRRQRLDNRRRRWRRLRAHRLRLEILQNIELRHLQSSKPIERPRQKII
ncbi:MAG: hypothetical protein JMDDDDMK_01095 [Acidobacteria bacterium]|nr:hypothetical protein [Acidobacteriota bacterium]